jgi:predicted transcriptional regulator
MKVMNLETRKINLINWISSLQEADIIDKMEAIQKENADWWDTINNEDKQAIEEGLEQLDKGEFLTRSQVRAKVKKKYNF